MKFSEFATAIRKLGRQITPDLLMATRKLVLPMIPADAGSGVKVVRDLHYGIDERQRLDVFTADQNPDAARPLLVFVHGGGFIAGDKHTEGSPFYSNIGNWAVQQGFNAVNVTYRLAPVHQWPSAVEDLDAVLEFITTSGSAHGIGQGPVFLMGQSAGAAHVASYVAHPQVYKNRSHRLTGIILLSGIFDYTTMPPGPMEQSYLGTDSSTYAAKSSLSGLLASKLPLLVCLTEMDPPLFEQQTLQLLKSWQQENQQLPRFVYAIGQNHLSQALYLGLDGDLLGPQLRDFIEYTVSANG